MSLLPMVNVPLRGRGLSIALFAVGLLLAGCGDDEPTGGCPAGTAGVDCAACDVGTYCAGGTEAAVPCAAGTWDADADPATACADWTVCAAGTRVSTQGSATVDRTCAACASDSFSTGTNAAQCTAMTICPAGQYVVTAGDATHDRVCGGCTSGSFSSTANASSCATWTDCPAGRYVTAQGTATADRVCADCAPGTYSSAVNSGNCAPVGTCAAGTYETTPATSTSDAVCTACVAGTYCPGGTIAPVACATNTWDDDQSAASPCVAWTDCVAGNHVVTDGTATTDRTCAACGNGTFTATSNLATCSSWQDCAAGTYVTQSPSATQDRTCTACSSASYSSTTNAAQCTTLTDCPAGQYVSTPATATNDRTCSVCASGTFSTQTNSPSCANIGSCAAGTIQTSPGSSTSDVVCQSCAPGQYCAGGTTAAVACGSGTWDDDQSAASPCVAWTDCQAGYHVDTSGSATTDRTCAACDPGTFTDAANQATCAAWTVCHAGYSVTQTPNTSRNRVCAPCSNGTFSTTDNADTCANWSTCSAGTYVSTPGSATNDRGCTNCASGTFSSYPNADQCTNATTCQAGYVLTTPATPTTDAVCTACNAGEYCAGGTNPVVSCGNGTWDNDSSPASPCVSWTTCSPPYQYMTADGSATSDRACGTCASGLVTLGNNSAGCSYPRNCNEMLNAYPTTATGLRSIDPDGLGNGQPFTVYCDMTTSGGGWTMIYDSNGFGSGGMTESVPGTTTVTIGSGLYMPVARVMGLSGMSAQVLVMTANNPSSYIVSSGYSAPIQNLRAGLGLSGTQPYSSATFSGPNASDATLQFSASCATQPWPIVYQACDNPTGLFVDGTHSTWDVSVNTPVDIALFIR